MLSIVKIQAASHQPGHLSYSKYLSPDLSGYHEYAQGDASSPLPFWVGRGVDALGLGGAVEPLQVERLSQGFHPLTGEPLVAGAGAGHVMGLDMTFSAPKDVSAVFAGADEATQIRLVETLQASVAVAMGYAESVSLTRHGHAGKVKRWVEAAIACCYTHFASRALDPQLHVHAFLFNLGKRRDGKGWGALEMRSQFDRKLATGILFRAELAYRVKELGFGVAPDGKFFTIEGITQTQRDELSTRSQEIKAEGQGATQKARDELALKTRAHKAEPPFKDLLEHFRGLSQRLGLSPEFIASLRGKRAPQDDFKLDHAGLLVELTKQSSCATRHEALALICEKAMGRWNAARCLDELEKLMTHQNVRVLGETQSLSEVFTTTAQLELEHGISHRVAAGKNAVAHRIDASLIQAKFKLLEETLTSRVGTKVDLRAQRDAALHIACQTGDHAFVEGWAGTGKTTLLQAVAEAYKEAGLEVLGCCQSAAASQNLARETGIPSRTIASLMLAVRDGKCKLTDKTVLVLDEAGMVGSREFEALQAEVVKAGAKLVCVGDSKQLQPIEAGGIFRSLMHLHGHAEISNIQRQRTDTKPLLTWLEEQTLKPLPKITPSQVKALTELPAEMQIETCARLCAADPLLDQAFKKWRMRFDHVWMRDAVKSLATGHAQEALELIDQHGGLHLHGSAGEAEHAVLDAWVKDKTELPSKTMIAATRAEVARLNAGARKLLVTAGVVLDQMGVELTIKDKNDVPHLRKMAPGDRIVFTENNKRLGVANGVTGTVIRISQGQQTSLHVKLDAPNPAGQISVEIPASFGRFDHAYCLTNHKGQGRTFDAAHVLVNAAMADREWSYVAASRSRFRTTIHIDRTCLEATQKSTDTAEASRTESIKQLAIRLSRSRAKGTTLDYELSR